MVKFNVVQKKKRAQKAERKRAVYGDPSTRKLKTKPQTVSLSGKRKRKLLKKWHRDQKEAVEKGLLTLQDVEMAAVDGEETQDAAHKASSSTKFPMKKKSLKLKHLKGKGKKKSKGKPSKPAAEAPPPADAMVE